MYQPNDDNAAPPTHLSQPGNRLPRRAAGRPPAWPMPAEPDNLRDREGLFQSSASRIGSLAVGERIGEGGHSVVRAARDLETGRYGCIKLPKGEWRPAVERIKREYRTVRRLEHDGVVSMQRLLRAGDRYAILMERLDGSSLVDAVRGSMPKGVLPELSGLIQITASLAESLSQIHARGWIHRDIKPENVLFATSGSPRWIDFGLADYLHRPVWIPPADDLIGTFAYLPPESIIGDTVDPSADMFSFGRLVALLVCGRLPSWDPTLGTEAADRRIREQLPAKTPKNLVELCTRLVRIAPDQRPTAAEAYHLLTGTDAPAHRGDGAHDPDLRRWLASAESAASEAYRRAARKQGSVLLVHRCDPQRRMLLEKLVNAAPDADPRLVIAGCCDATEETPLPAFDDILDQLAIWLRQLPPTICRRWRPACRDALAAVAPELASALGMHSHDLRAPTPSQLDQACECIADLFTRIAQQRTVVLVLHNLDQIDAASMKLMRRLVAASNMVPLIMLASTESDGHSPRGIASDETMQSILAPAEHRIITQ